MANDLDFFENEDGRVSVLLPLGLGRVLDYRFSGKRPALGSFVKVPLGGRSVIGVVWQKLDGDKEFPLSKLKPIYEILRVPLMSAEQQKFVNWVADYTLSMPGNVLKMSMSVPDALKKLPTQTLYRKTSGAHDPMRLTEKRLKALEQIIENKTYSAKEIARLGGVSEAVVRGMIKLGLLEGVERLRDRPYLPPDPTLPGPDLTDEQTAAVAALKTSLDKGFRPTALEGVTGSGKTEVYFEAIAEVLKKPEAQVLILLPEIALTNQLLDRFEARFGARPIEWHSDLGKAERRRAWRSVIAGEARIVVGARSALFLPFTHLSLIIVEGGVSEAVVRGMIKLGLLEGVERLRDRPYLPPDPTLPGPDLTDEQTAAVAALKTSLDKGFRPTALEGVTGSGKTEVYFEAIAEVLKKPEAQVLILLPEIALTNQLLDRFEARFGARPIEWHSDLGKAERRRAWRSVIAGEARIVVGARSALFLPFTHLSLIIVDEEHDQSFKQEEGVPYHARDMAVMRANLAECAIILSSATLSYETLANIERERYARVTLKKRYGGATLPDISGIDMREEKLPADRWLSNKLVEELKATLARGEQGMLFLNRRGYAPLTLCRTCGTRIECPDCTAWLVEHRLKARLICHHCGYSVPKPKHCPECGDTESLAICGPGVERLEEEVATLFPSAKRLVMTSDTMTSPAKAAEMVAKIATGVADIIIGTQVITKGYHFPNLTLVGVIDADLGLKGGDLRAGERTFQQLEQVAGRAGREHLKGHVFIQTFMPENPVMAALLSGDKPRFITEDMKQRRQYGMPPFGRLASVVISGPKHRDVEDFAHVLARAFPGRDGVQLFGPAQAYMARLKGQFRYRLLVKAGRNVHLQNLIRGWMDGLKIPPRVKAKIDIDPYSFL